MANVTVKLFGVLRVDSHLAQETIEAERVEDIFQSLNDRVDVVYNENKLKNPKLEHPDKLDFKDVVIFINGERCSKKRAKLNDNDEIWLLSPASGG